MYSPRNALSVVPRTIAAVVCLAGASGCGVLSTTTELPVSAPLQSASREALVEAVQRFAAIQSMKAVVDITLTLQAADRSKETRYRNVRGALVTRRPGWIRTSGETPGGIAKVYDMVSDGQRFQVHVPWENKVYKGLNELTHVSENRFKNLRPQHILEAIMIEPVENTRDMLLDVEMYGRAGYQVLLQTEEDANGTRLIRRKYWFSRTDLRLARLMILDDRTEVATDAWYREWVEDNQLPYPRFIRIARPQDGYELEIEIVRPGINATIPDSSFELALPSGIETETVGAPPSAQS